MSFSQSFISIGPGCFAFDLADDPDMLCCDAEGLLILPVPRDLAGPLIPSPRLGQPSGIHLNHAQQIAGPHDGALVIHFLEQVQGLFAELRRPAIPFHLRGQNALVLEHCPFQFLVTYPAGYLECLFVTGIRFLSPALFAKDVGHLPQACANFTVLAQLPLDG